MYASPLLIGMLLLLAGCSILIPPGRLWTGLAVTFLAGACAISGMAEFLRRSGRVNWSAARSSSQFAF